MSQLRHLAEYFWRMEPLGPTAPLLDVAVRWGTMSFAEWLREVMGDARMLDDPSGVLGLLYTQAAMRSEVTAQS